jgi:hypothetical protein
MTAWANKFATKSPDYIEFGTYEFVLEKKRQVFTVGIGPHRWELIHFEANSDKYALPVGWEQKWGLCGEFVMINREAA